jgi:hypothetical protein
VFLLSLLSVFLVIDLHDPFDFKLTEHVFLMIANKNNFLGSDYGDSSETGEKKGSLEKGDKSLLNSFFPYFTHEV